MKLYRLLIGCLTLLLWQGPVLSQEAVERTNDSNPFAQAEPSLQVEPTPVPGTSQTESRVERTESRKTESVRKTERSSGALQDSMTATEFKSAGLEKLSADELKNLNDWLQGYRKKAETQATEKATAEVTKKVTAQTKAKFDRVESRVDGTVPHLTGHSIIKLEDGTSWKQANTEDHYASPNIDHPTAIVSRSAFGWKMRIAGLPEFYVDPVR